MTSTRRVLFVFAHQDDEIAAAARILEEIRAGANVCCVYLTDGEAFGSAASLRDAESSRVLQRLGVSSENIHFMGSHNQIPDGALVEHLDRALDGLRLCLDGIAIDEIFCLAYEGGHQDHDASHLVALAFASIRGLMDRCWAMPVYRGLGLPGPLFRVFSPLHSARIVRKVAIGDSLRVLSLFTAYPSQRPSIYALIPGAIVRLLILRRMTLHRPDPRRVRERPHKGRLFYEGRYRFPYDRFETASRAFIERYLPD